MLLILRTRPLLARRKRTVLKNTESRIMHMPPPVATETAKAIELGHEPSTVSVKGVLWFFIVFFAFAAVVHVIIYVLYRGLVK